MSTNVPMILSKYVKALEKIYGTYLKLVILYGSYARRDFSEDSDIDIMILLDQGKMRFLSDGIDKWYQIEMAKIANETEIQLAQIQGNVRIQIEKIDKYYDLEMQRLLAEYNLQHEEMNLYYDDLEKQRKEQAKRFKYMMKLATIDRKKAQKAIEEAEEVAKFFKKKICENTATREEREHYMELLKFRVCRGEEKKYALTLEEYFLKSRKPLKIRLAGTFM